MDEDAHRFALLLEDFAGFSMEDQLVGISRARAAEAIAALAGFHAAWWQSPVLDSLTWMPPVNGPITMQVAPAYRQGWPVFLEHFGADLPEGSVELGERVGEQFESLLDRAATPPLTICHADFRLDNLFFGPKGTRDAVALIDFQLVTTGRGVFDVAYLLCQSMEVDERRASELDLLRRWHAVVTKAGVRDYPLDQALHDYKLASLICLCYPVTSGGTLDLANDRGVALVRAMAVRTFTAALDLEAAALLG
jgi:aminoglycoside/choline kinase family phosphotransferase